MQEVSGSTPLCSTSLHGMAFRRKNESPGSINIRIWWPNVLSLDAALIAVLWYTLFADSIGTARTGSAALVLALSVWLTYTADRLFDVSKRQPEHLLSTRHQFAKTLPETMELVVHPHQQCFARPARPQQGTAAQRMHSTGNLPQLHPAQPEALETLFPKTSVRRRHFRAGIVIFLPTQELWLQGLSFMCLCLINCRLISSKEVKIDDALGEHTQVIAAHSRTLRYR